MRIQSILLTENQRKAVEAYVISSNDIFSEITGTNGIALSQEGFTFQLNSLLRAGIAVNNRTMNYCEYLDSAFNSFGLTEDITVFRACNYQEMLRYIQSNKYFDPGYMSTSKSTSSVHRFFETPKLGYYPAFLTIKIPSGSNVLDLNNIQQFENNTYEDEVLLKRKSLFQIISTNEMTTQELEDKIGREIQDHFKSIFSLSLQFERYL